MGDAILRALLTDIDEIKSNIARLREINSREAPSWAHEKYITLISEEKRKLENKTNQVKERVRYLKRG